jgi:hypothetical protein
MQQIIACENKIKERASFSRARPDNKALSQESNVERKHPSTTGWTVGAPVDSIGISQILPVVHPNNRKERDGGSYIATPPWPPAFSESQIAQPLFRGAHRQEAP